MSAEPQLVVIEILEGKRTLKEAIRSFERECVLAALERANFDKRRAASLLGISLASLYRKLERS
ncbi:MAG: hypothetical protein HYU51_09975 [Candidatus Rokubacteria bacterium]|nr:hypothetical protein [Candidatus Rokubacteria bacterium]